MREVILKFPSLEDNLKSAVIYDSFYDKCVKAGVITKNKILIHLVKHEILTPSMQTEIENVEGGDLFKYPSLPEFRDKQGESRFIEKSIVEVITGERRLSIKELFDPTDDGRDSNPTYIRYRELSIIKNTYMKHTAEAMADQERVKYLTSRCVFDAATGKRIWNTFEDLKSSKNKLFLTALTGKFIDFVSGLNQTIIRKISKHSLWRTKWISATKTGAPIFRGYVAEWDVNKSYLCYWSNFLDNVYSSVEPPEEFIINDDRLLDAWIEAKFRDHKNGTNTSSGDGDTTRAVFKTRVNPIKKK